MRKGKSYIKFKAFLVGNTISLLEELTITYTSHKVISDVLQLVKRTNEHIFADRSRRHSFQLFNVEVITHSYSVYAHTAVFECVRRIGHAVS